MSFNVHITLREAPADADEPFDLWASEGQPGACPNHVVFANLPFGRVLSEVERFLDLNVR